MPSPCSKSSNTCLKKARLFAAIYDTTFGKVVRRQLDGYIVAGKDSNIVFTHLSRYMGCYNVPILELDSKSRVWQGLGDDTLHLNGFFFRQGLPISMSKKPANCAEMDALLQCGSPPFPQRISYRNRGGWPI